MADCTRGGNDSDGDDYNIEFDCDTSSEFSLSGYNFESDSDADGESSSAAALRIFGAPGQSTLAWQDADAECSSAAALKILDVPDPSSLAQQDTNGRANGAAPSASVLAKLLAMGFTREEGLRGIEEIGDSDVNALVALILTYQEKGGDVLMVNCSNFGCNPKSVDEEDSDLGNWDEDDDAGAIEPCFDDSYDEGLLHDRTDWDEKVHYLLGMGFPRDEIYMAIERCDMGCDISELINSISASQAPPDEGNKVKFVEESKKKRKRYRGGALDERKTPKIVEESKKKRKRYGGGAQERKKTKFVAESKKKRKRLGGGAQESQDSVDYVYDEVVRPPNPMVGFSLPNRPEPMIRRRLPKAAIGPPFFYYENVARAPEDVWSTISRHLYEVEPEFVDSKSLCAAKRKRGYVHNLPVENRSAVHPLPKTIFEIFPHYQESWPSWDKRTQFNCLQTREASAKLVAKICKYLEPFRDTNAATQYIQRKIMDECRRWNLVWVGKKRVAPLEASEMELLLGFPKNYTRGHTKAQRYQCLGSSFHVDMVAYHLSVLRDLFPNGINVLSLFSGIGGAEVALDRLGIRLNTVVSVERSEVSRSIFRSWWNQSEQKGTLIELEDVQTITPNQLEEYMRTYGGFDLVVGGSPCDNLGGSNRHHRVGLSGTKSSLFFQYCRILDIVKSIMRRM